MAVPPKPDAHALQRWSKVAGAGVLITFANADATSGGRLELLVGRKAEAAARWRAVAPVARRIEQRDSRTESSDRTRSSARRSRIFAVDPRERIGEIGAAQPIQIGEDWRQRAGGIESVIEYVEATFC